MKKDILIKSLKKAIKKVRHKNALEDVLDSDMVAEMSPDETGSYQNSVIQKSKECECEEKKDCECEEKIDKAEMFSKKTIENFKKMSEIYLKKSQQDFSHPEFFNNHEGIISENHPDRERAANYITKLAQKPSKDGENTNKLEARRLYDKHISGGSSYTKNEKPFHGYNKNKHSKKGGLSEKERNRINREEGRNLKAPVSSKEAKKSPKKASRRKSFCARMSGVKGPTSKKGKLTPKGAALKRWDC